MASRGLRTLCLAYTDFPASDPSRPEDFFGESHDDDLTLLCIVGIKVWPPCLDWPCNIVTHSIRERLVVGFALDRTLRQPHVPAGASVPESLIALSVFTLRSLLRTGQLRLLRHHCEVRCMLRRRSNRGFFVTQDPVRAEVPDAVAVCKRAGIMVRMVTGDNTYTAQHIARECGILTDGIALEGPDFRSRTDEDLMEILPSVQVSLLNCPRLFTAAVFRECLGAEMPPSIRDRKCQRSLDRLWPCKAHEHLELERHHLSY